MSRQRPKPIAYQDLASIIDHLPILIHERRRAQGLNLIQAGEQSGIGYYTFRRIEAGEEFLSPAFPKLLRWLGGPDGSDQPV